jgi:hypothetical protein
MKPAAEMRGPAIRPSLTASRMRIAIARAQSFLRVFDRAQHALQRRHREDRGHGIRFAAHFQMRVCVDETRRDARGFVIALSAGVAQFAHDAVFDQKIDIFPRRIQRAVVKNSRAHDHGAARPEPGWRALSNA